jgi:phage gp45-like
MDESARIATLERRLDRLERRTAMGVAFARSTNQPVDSGTVQTLQGQIDALSIRDAMPVLYHYGFSASMPLGGDHVVIFGNGERSSGVVVATNHQQYRFTGLANGEAVLYNKVTGTSVLMGASGIVIDGGGQNIMIQNSPTITADVTLFRVSGEILDHYNTNTNGLGYFRSNIYDIHIHHDPQGGDVSVPVPLW